MRKRKRKRKRKRERERESNTFPGHLLREDVYNPKSKWASVPQTGRYIAYHGYKVCQATGTGGEEKRPTILNLDCPG